MKIAGIIVHGKQLGRTLGYPTANLAPDAGIASDAPNGVYVGLIALEGYAKPLPCMVNQGSHPTAPGGPPTIEAHILDFGDDIYGLRAEVEYLRFLRPERKFASLDALKAQLARDLAATRQYFSEHGDMEPPACAEPFRNAHPTDSTVQKV